MVDTEYPAFRVFRDVDSFVVLRESWRTDGMTLVLTRGVFDLLHEGHLSYIEAAANLGDRLAIFVDSDDKVKLRKGGGRPIHTFALRADKLIATGFADAVVEFGITISNEDLVRLVQPEIFVVSEERVAQNNGYEYARPFVGEIVSLIRTEGISTTLKLKQRGEG